MAIQINKAMIVIEHPAQGLPRYFLSYKLIMKQLLRFTVCAFLLQLAASASYAQTSGPDPLKEGLVVWLPLDEQSGTQAADAADARRPATLVNGGTWQPSGGHSQGSLQLGPLASLRIPLPWQPTQFSVCWWVKANSRANWTQSVGASLNYTLGGWWSGFLFHTAADGRIYVGTGYPGWLELPSETFKTGVWQHFVFTFEARVG
jgi:hypothetical protein